MSTSTAPGQLRRTRFFDSFAAVTLVAFTLLVAVGVGVRLTRGTDGGGPLNPKHRFETRLENGLAMAVTSGGPKFRGELFSYDVVTQTEMARDGRWYLRRPVDATVDAAGNLYVADAARHRVVVFDRAGQFSHNIGHRGEAVGELLYPSRVDLWGGSVWIETVGRRRIVRFATDGSYLDEILIPGQAYEGALAPRLWVASDGRKIVRLSSEDSAGGLLSKRLIMLVLDSQGREQAKVFTPAVSEYQFVDPKDGGRPVAVPIYFAGQSWAGYVEARGIFISTGEEPVIDWYGLDGVHAERIRIELPPRPITDLDRSRVIGRLETELQEVEFAADWTRNAYARRRARVRRDNPSFADTKAYWDYIDVDDRGFLWLWVLPNYGGARSRSEVPRAHVVAPDGSYIGVTSMPTTGRILHGHLVAPLVTDRETGAPQPTVFSIRPRFSLLEY